ncbi:MAG: NAD-dependent epimerase/dehydratase family protein [Candidatus Omnitrophica bacterium]|nr:NAD-dependent epimerase/dehydratase family protein [Candidatus Omnitrophota bacterium]
MILITGAAGFLGHHLLKQLEKEKIDYLFLVRKKNLKGRNVIYGDILEDNWQRDIKVPIDNIIHLAAVIDDGDKNLFKVNIKGTEKIVKLAEKLKVKNFIFLSSALVNFKDIETPYVKSKREGEKIVLGSNLSWTILRPTQTYGLGDKKNFGWILNFIKKNPVVPIFSGNLFLQPVYVDDVVKAITACLNNKSSERKIYNLGGPEILKLEEIEKLMIKKIKNPKIKIYFPHFLLKLLINVKDFLPPFLRKKLMILSKFEKVSFLEYKEAEKDLNFRPIKFKEGLSLWLKKY